MRPDTPLRRVEPLARKTRAYRWWCRVLGTRAAGWLSRVMGWKLDPLVLRATGGRLGLGLFLPTALLETRGARSGLVRRNGVIYFHDGECVMLVASKLGAPEHPAWYHNACAHPDVALNGRPFRASVVDDRDERERLFALAEQVFPPYATYRERAAATGRTIPLLRLEPVAPDACTGG